MSFFYMRGRWLLGGIVCYVMLFSVGCAEERPEDGGTGADSLRAKPALELSMEGDTAQYRDTVVYMTETGKAPKENEELTKIVMAYPSIKFAAKVGSGDSINDFVGRILRLDGHGELAYTSISARMEDFIAEYKAAEAENREIYEEMGLEYVDAKWSCEVQVRVLLNTPNLLTLRYDEVNFTGGAHANMATRFYNFDMRRGKLLEMDELFEQPEMYASVLMPLAHRAFKREMAAAGKGEGYVDENFNFNKLPEHFAITRTGILFSFDPYEVGAFSDGTIQFEVPYGDLLPYLNREVIR